MTGSEVLESEMLVNIIIATLSGFVSRWLVLKVDYRQCPTVPNGYLIHLTIGLVSSALGAISIPALLAKDFSAVTFFLLAFQHFRNVRQIEAESLTKIDKLEYHPRGAAYIDGIAKTFESRNYLALIVSVTTIILLVAMPIIYNRYVNIVIALLIAYIVHLSITYVTKGKKVKDIVDIEIGEISFKSSNLYINDIYVMNLGIETIQKRIIDRGIGVILKPKGENEAIMINNLGQRKAIEHECARLLGLERYIETRRDFSDGLVAMVVVLIRKEPESLIDVIGNVPLLEVLRKQAKKK